MNEDLFVCPHCGSVETPKLVVRGSGRAGESGLSLRCRACDLEQPDTQARAS